tara:strand:+ start:11495 stop:11686 length:192 start_codon:yes stop_codon:yes gene_type:complete
MRFTRIKNFKISVLDASVKGFFNFRSLMIISNDFLLNSKSPIFSKIFTIGINEDNRIFRVSGA